MPRKIRKRTQNVKCEMNVTKNSKKSTKCESGKSFIFSWIWNKI